MSVVMPWANQGWRMAASVSCAVGSKIAALTRGRGPSRSCQIPILEELVRAQFGKERRGVFVEVGAYDGERFSNTSWLADQGWRGVYVEPSRRYARLCRLRHLLNNVQVLNCAAGDSDSTAMLTQIGSLSTMSRETLAEYDRIPWARHQIAKECREQPTEVRTLDRILRDTGINRGFELLVVDVEGFEESVFSAFDLTTWCPQMVIVELCDVHPDFADNENLIGSARRVRERILAAGYVERYRDTINTIFGWPSATACQAA